MGLFTDTLKRHKACVDKKEEMVLPFSVEKGTYKGVLTSGTKTILSRINKFLYYPQFVPGELLFDERANKRGVKLILDDRKERTYKVTPDVLEDEWKKTKEEINKLNDILQELGQPNNDDKSLSELRERLEGLNGKVSEIERRLRDGDYVIKNELLGYYCRSILDDGSSQPEIHLMMGTLGEDHILTAITFVHELMHAYFDHHAPVTKHPHCRSIEEPLAEYGMLCFIEMFSRNSSCYPDFMSKAESRVKAKRYALGVCDYGYGYYLFKDKGKFGADWVTLFHEYCHLVDMESDNVKSYGAMVSPIRYPEHERACELRLLDILRPKRFSFECKSDWRSNGKELYFYIDKDVCNSCSFLKDYKTKDRVHLTFYDNKGDKQFDGEATLVSQGRFRLLKSLRCEYAKVFGTIDHRRFKFYENLPSDGTRQAEWIARLLPVVKFEDE